ncbi:hypothetical protein ACLESD_12220 [Pyxidicoccus sp. 3LFB2]
MKRLLWLVGPPAAGKSTGAEALKELPHPPRILELAQWLYPLMDTAKRRKGMMRAKGLLIQAIRTVELEPANGGLPPLVVISAIQRDSELFPLSPEEEVLLLLPSRAQWELQFLGRAPVHAPGSHPMNLEEASGWYEHYLDWLEKGLPVRRLMSSKDLGVVIQELR